MSNIGNNALVHGEKQSSSSDLSDDNPMTTTVSTVAVQAGDSKIVLAILNVCYYHFKYLYKDRFPHNSEWQLDKSQDTDHGSRSL